MRAEAIGGAGEHVVADAELLDARTDSDDGAGALQAERVARHGAVDDPLRQDAHGLEHVLEVEPRGAERER